MLIVFLMGANNVGKTTLRQYAVRNHADIGEVTVGDYFRAKYLDPQSPHYDPDFFKGQAAPAHTEAEAWEVAESAIRKHVKDGKRIIIVDGQPRSAGQVDACMTRLPPQWQKMFLLLHTSMEVRQQRLAKRFKLPEQQAEYDLAVSRLTNDMVTYYTVLAELLLRQRHCYIEAVDSTNPDFDSIIEDMYEIESL